MNSKPSNNNEDINNQPAVFGQDQNIDCKENSKNSSQKRVYKRSAETRAAISRALTGRVRSPEERAAISKGLKGKKKNYITAWTGKTGPNHPSYIHGKGKNREYDPAKLQAWQFGVRTKANFKCFITGESDRKKLACHHLYSWEHEDKRYDIDNGVLISSEIHRNFHKKYGRGGNTPEQFEEFCRENYGINVFPWRQGNHEPSLSVEIVAESLKTAQQNKFEEFQVLCSERGHVIISGEYIRASSPVILFCEKHKQQYETTFTNYKKCRTGLKCCGRENQSIKSMNYTRKNDGTFTKDG
jgi:hypothetical protein